MSTMDHFDQQTEILAEDDFDADLSIAEPMFDALDMIFDATSGGHIEECMNTQLMPDMSLQLLDAVDNEPDDELDEEAHNDIIFVDAVEKTDSSLSTSGMTYYMNLLNRFGVPTIELERHFGRLARQGDRKAIHWMMMHNLRLVISHARYSQSVSGMELIDLISYGNLGLYRAVEKFDPDKGYRFSTYATLWIRQALMRAVSTDKDTVRCPYHIMVKTWRLNRLERDLAKKNQKMSRAEYCEALGLSDEALSDILFHRTKTHSCFDDPAGNDDQGKSYAEILAADSAGPEDDAFHGEHTKVAETLLCKLNDKQLRVVSLRYGLDGHGGKTLEEVGQVLQLTKERVRQIEAEALRKMRCSAGNLGIFRADVI